MTDTTARLSLPLIAAAQSQKHVTHNEALALLDSLVMPSLVTKGLTAPPGSPSEGQTWIVAGAGGSAAGAWAGKEMNLARWQDGAWLFIAPGEGWLAWVADEKRLYIYSGAAWATALGGSALFAASAVVDFNVGNADTAITLSLPPGFTRFAINAVTISGASHSLTTATGGLFTAAAGGGVAIVTGASALTVSATAENTNNNLQAMATNNTATQSYNVGTLYWRVATPEGAAATATVTVHYRPLP